MWSNLKQLLNSLREFKLPEKLKEIKIERLVSVCKVLNTITPLSAYEVDNGTYKLTILLRHLDNVSGRLRLAGRLPLLHSQPLPLARAWSGDIASTCQSQNSFSCQGFNQWAYDGMLQNCRND